MFISWKKCLSNIKLTALSLSFPLSPPLSLSEEEEVTLCIESETATLTPPTRPGDVSSGGSSPGQPPVEPMTERKASDVSPGYAQTLEEKSEGQQEGSSPSMSAN